MAIAETFVQYIVEKRIVRETHINRATYWERVFATEFQTGSFYKKKLEELIDGREDYRIKTIAKTSVLTYVEADGEVQMYVPSPPDDY